MYYIISCNYSLQTINSVAIILYVFTYKKSSKDKRQMIIGTIRYINKHIAQNVGYYNHYIVFKYYHTELQLV